MNPLFLIIGIVVVLIIVIVLVVVGLRSPEETDALQTRLAEYSSRENPVTLEEIELSQPFSERILLPVIRQLGQFAARFTPQASLESVKHQLDLAGNPKGILFKDASTLWAIRIIACVGLGGLILFVTMIAPPGSALSIKSSAIKALGFALGGAVLGFFMPVMLLKSKITRRQDEIIKAMPDALDLLTVCVEAGLGFDQAMSKVNEKWENELSLAFGRVIAEIRIGKLRREALRDMAERMDIPDVTSFAAAIIQADQLGVSIGKVLRIQSEQMRIKRRQRAEKKAHEAPIKMLIPMAFLIFPSIYIVLLGPAVLILITSPAIKSTFGGG
jgi:tight adherence protein C